MYVHSYMYKEVKWSFDVISMVSSKYVSWKHFAEKNNKEKPLAVHVLDH